ncbi:hypothetical protein [Streptomyces sp900116325]|uniref:hypothetical protein n=1 Tax=Streptomyces sp. 900116325 TaxID=3154295 RepID=UPI0033AE933B
MLAGTSKLEDKRKATAMINRLVAEALDISPDGIFISLIRTRISCSDEGSCNWPKVRRAGECQKPPDVPS